MEKIHTSEKEDLWYFNNSLQGFCLGLQIESKIRTKVTSFDVALNRDGHPHLLLEKEGDLEHYFWSGKNWLKGKNPLIKNPLFFGLAFNGENELHLLVTTLEQRYHFVLESEGWSLLEYPILPDFSKPEAFFWQIDLGLTIIFSALQTKNIQLGLNCYRKGKWCTWYLQSIESGRLLNWTAGITDIFFLVGSVTIPASVLYLYVYNIKSKESKLEAVIPTKRGWDNTPGLFIDASGDCLVCWSYRGLLSAIEIKKDTTLVTAIESDLFYPAEILPFFAREGNNQKIALKVIYGYKLEFPLVLSLDAFKAMLKRMPV